MEQATGMSFLVDGEDMFRTGLTNMKASARAAHPVEQIQRTHHEDEMKRNLQTMKCVYGTAMAARHQIETQLLSSVGRMGGLPSSRIGLDTMNNRLDKFSFESYIGTPADGTDLPVDIHSQMESKLKMGTKFASRAV